jgi:sirohydrochlorin ferrochelatase
LVGKSDFLRIFAMSFHIRAPDHKAPDGMTLFQLALKRIDAANAEDPNTILVGGEARPAELVYSERMSAMLERLVPEASQALQLAVRAQHLRRWTIPRDRYPMDRSGYHRWRGELKRRQADWASAILDECGFDAETTARVASLIRKDNLKTDAETQTLEDVACLVFLKFYAADFAAKHDHPKMIGIVQKTWNKMSEVGQEAALAMPIDASVRAILNEALARVKKPVRAVTLLRDVAIILAAHGDRGGAHPNSTIRGHCVALADDKIFHSVSVGILRGEPQLEVAVSAALEGGAKALAVYPMFMAEGYFTRKVLIQRLAALEIPIDVHVLAPLGADPRMPMLMLRQAIDVAGSHGLALDATRLLIVGHGSQIGPASAEATRNVASVIAQERQFARVETAFLEEPEFLEDALSREGKLPTVVLGFFSGDGLHAAEDVPQAISETGAIAVYAGSIGKSPSLPELIRSSISAAFGSETAALGCKVSLPPSSVTYD